MVSSHFCTFIALTMPQDPQLAQRARRLVLWSIREEKGKGVVMAALQLAINPHIATSGIMRNLTYKAAQLLLADGAHSPEIRQ